MKTKIITDGSIKTGENLAISAYIIYQEGEEIASDLEVFEPPNFESEYAEAKAVRLGINKALELGIENLVVGCDNLNVVEALRDKTQLGRYGDIRMIKKEVQEAESFRIFHVPRSEVEPAHKLCQKYEEEMQIA